MLRKIREKVADVALKGYREELKERIALTEKEAEKVLEKYRAALNAKDPNPMTIAYLHDEWMLWAKDSDVLRSTLRAYDQHLNM